MRSEDSRCTATAATLCAALGLAVHVGGAIARDGFLLSQSDPGVLPALVAIASVAAIAAALALRRVTARLSPGRIVPLLGAGSAALLLAEWLAQGAAPRAVAVAVYLHVTVLGPILLSGSSAIVNAATRSGSARTRCRLIAVAWAAGGFLGGLLIERLSAQPARIDAILPVLAALQLVHAWRLRALVARTDRAPGHIALPPPSPPPLRRLALLVFLASCATVFLDIAFKLGASASGAGLLHRFAVFHTACAGATAVVQAIFAALAGERLAPPAFPGALPVTLAAAAAAIPFPGLLAVARGAVTVARRACSPSSDVIAARAGALAGALGAAALLGAGSARLLLPGAAALGVLGLIVAPGRRAALARELRARTPSALGASAILSLLALRSPLFLPAATRRPPRTPAATADSLDAVAAAVAALRSGDPARVVAVLRPAPLPLALVAHTVPLLAWGDVAPAAAAALATMAPRIVGQLVDRLLDPDEEVAIRRRIPALLGQAPGALAAWGLTRGLTDPRFEVRYRCGGGLRRLSLLDPSVELDSDLLLDAVQRELRARDALREDRRPRVAHVFRLLVLALHDPALALAFRGIHLGDAHVRATALAYLGRALPGDVRDALWPVLDDAGDAARRGAAS